MNNEIKNVTPMPKSILGRVQFGERVTKGGIFLKDDNGKSEGIYPRWAKVWKVGTEITDVNPGDWVMVEHGRWSFETKIQLNGSEFTFFKIDPNGIMFVNESGLPDDVTDFVDF